MHKARILLFLGTWVAVLPFLGFPYSWKDTLTLLTGLILIGFSYILYRDYLKVENKSKTFDSFSENSNFSEANAQDSNSEDGSSAASSEE